MKIRILFFLFFLPLFSSALPKDSINYYEKAIRFFIDSILPKEDDKLIIYFNGETEDFPSMLIGCRCSFDRSIYDSATVNDAISKELSSGFGDDNNKNKIKVDIIKPIRKGNIGTFFTKNKRNMKITQIREIKGFKQINIILSEKSGLYGYTYCIIFDKNNNIVKWCKSNWVV